MGDCGKFPRDGQLSHLLSQFPSSMRYSSQLVVLAATASAASAISYKGISPDQLSLYEAKVPSSSPAKWKCLNTSQEIPHTAVNDNYCDCEDGSDEPGRSCLNLPN